MGVPEIVYLIDPVMKAVEARLNEPGSLELFDAIVQKYQSNEDRIYVRRGRAKVNDKFPVICLEALSRQEPWGAINYTKDIKIDLNVYVMVKVVGGTSRNEKVAQAVEEYIIELGETLQGILNERGKQQYTNFDGKGGSIYDSYAETATYEYLYNGAVRAAKMPWFGKLWLFGVPPSLTNVHFSS